MTGLETLMAKIMPLVEGLGYEFWGSVLINSGRTQLLRIYIDSQKGIDVEDCATVSRQISAILDVEDPIAGRYTLEVSSPGLDRPLFDLKHYERYVGQRVQIRLKTPRVDRRKNFAGTLKGVEGKNIHLILEKQEVVLEYDNIAQAHVITDI